MEQRRVNENGVELKNVICWSGGKDSTATVILAHEHNIPIDEIVFVEVMFNNTISGEIPEHIDFVKNVAIPKFEEWGYKVTIIHSEQTFVKRFNRVITRSRKPETNGKKEGYPYRHVCDLKNPLKVMPMQKYLRSFGDYVDFVGIAKDEPKRLASLFKQKNKRSLLDEYNLTEQQARELCEKYGLLSPVYEFTKRQGCWFCANIGYGELKHLYKYHRHLLEELVKLEEENKGKILNDCWDVYEKATMKMILENEDRLAAEEQDKLNNEKTNQN